MPLLVLLLIALGVMIGSDKPAPKVPAGGGGGGPPPPGPYGGGGPYIPPYGGGGGKGAPPPTPGQNVPSEPPLEQPWWEKWLMISAPGSGLQPGDLQTIASFTPAVPTRLIVLLGAAGQWSTAYDGSDPMAAYQTVLAAAMAGNQAWIAMPCGQPAALVWDSSTPAGLAVNSRVATCSAGSWIWELWTPDSLKKPLPMPQSRLLGAGPASSTPGTVTT